MRPWNSIHPKVGAGFLAALVAWAVARFGLEAEDETILLALVPVLAGYLWPAENPDVLEGVPADVDETGENDV